MSNYEGVIKTCRCDLCSKRSVGVEHTIRGTPTLFECKDCAPECFEESANTLIGQVIGDLLAA